MSQSQKNRKEEEREHYDALARTLRGSKREAANADADGIRHDLFSSYRFFEHLIQSHASGKRVLDYGCGTGIHSITAALAKANEVIGVDLSEESLKIARERAKRSLVADRVKFQTMDCEQLTFKDSVFDIVIDGGVFSSLKLEIALQNIARVLKPDGLLIGIETLGHNPITNFKRKLNVIRGIRTQWAAHHIFKITDYQIMSQYFHDIHASYFHLLSLAALSFSKVPGSSGVISFFDTIDSLILKLPPLKKYAFKTVFTASRPKKTM